MEAGLRQNPGSGTNRERPEKGTLPVWNFLSCAPARFKLRGSLAAREDDAFRRMEGRRQRLMPLRKESFR